MKPVEPSIVEATHVVRKLIKNPDEYQKNLKKVLKKSRLNRIEMANSTSYKDSWDELFHGSAKWFKTVIDPNKERILNKIFNNLFGINNLLGVSLKEAIIKYKNGTLPNKSRKMIDNIRKTLKQDPKPIVLTEDQKEFAVYDGWHTILAFALENKKVHIFLGIGKFPYTYK